MKVGIVGAGDCSRLNPGLDYIAVDNGLTCLVEQGLEPKLVIGDFDSLQDLSLLKKYNPIVLPPVKDDTDLHIALVKAIELGYDEIVLYGVTGGRLDHFMAALNLLYRYREYRIAIENNQNRIYYSNSTHHLINNDAYKYFSLFSFSTNRISITNAKYPLQDYCLTIGDTLCVSNEPQGEVEITSTTGLFIFLSNER